MGKYRIWVEAPEEAAVRLGKLANDGMECDGFILIMKKDNVETGIVENTTHVEMATMFANEPVLCAAAKAGEALAEIVKVKRDFDRTAMFTEAMKKYSNI